MQYIFLHFFLGPKNLTKFIHRVRRTFWSCKHRVSFLGFRIGLRSKPYGPGVPLFEHQRKLHWSNWSPLLFRAHSRSEPSRNWLQGHGSSRYLYRVVWVAADICPASLLRGRKGVRAPGTPLRGWAPGSRDWICGVYDPVQVISLPRASVFARVKWTSWKLVFATLAFSLFWVLLGTKGGA